MTKKKSSDLESELFENIEEIDKEINDFYIDKEKLENIKYSFNIIYLCEYFFPPVYPFICKLNIRCLRHE